MINITICDPYGFIYITTNLITGEKYIGQKKFENGNHKNRWVNYLGSGLKLVDAIKKYGKDNFVRDILYISFSKDDLDKAERDYISFMNANNSDDFYNSAIGGDAVGIKFSDEYKRKMSEIKRLHPYKHTDEAKEKISLGHAKPIIQYDLNGNFIREWAGTKIAARVLNMCSTSILRCCQNKYKQAGGYVWRYKV